MLKSAKKQNREMVAIGLILAMVLMAIHFRSGIHNDFPREAAYAQQDEPMPTADPLEIPELPENPTPLEIGRVSYYYNCMPCHGDHGQGLTDEWRATWVEDHQNCWARGCHSGRVGDEGFPLPDTIPAVAGAPGVLDRFASPQSLFEYLKLNHPPQKPGVLPDEEYWALTLFLLAENGQELPDLPSGSQLTMPGSLTLSHLGVIVAAAMMAVSTGLYWLKQRRRR